MKSRCSEMARDDAVRRDGPAREPSLSAFWLQKPSILRACVREEDTGGREAGAHSTTPTYTVRRKGRSCEGAELVGVLVAETIHPACMCEGGGRGGERGGRAFCYTYIYS